MNMGSYDLWWCHTSWRKVIALQRLLATFDRSLAIKSRQFAVSSKNWCSEANVERGKTVRRKSRLGWTRGQWQRIQLKFMAFRWQTIVSGLKPPRGRGLPRPMEKTRAIPQHMYNSSSSKSASLQVGEIAQHMWGCLPKCRVQASRANSCGKELRDCTEKDCMPFSASSWAGVFRYAMLSLYPQQVSCPVLANVDVVVVVILCTCISYITLHMHIDQIRARQRRAPDSAQTTSNRVFRRGEMQLHGVKSARKSDAKHVSHFWKHVEIFYNKKGLIQFLVHFYRFHSCHVLLHNL